MINPSGIWPVLITPFKASLDIDYYAYEEFLDWQLSHPIGGLYANCLSSEMHHLEPGEMVRLVRTAAQQSNGKVPVAATGNFGKDLEAQVDFCKRMADAGADIVMLTIPNASLWSTEWEEYFLYIADRTEIRLGIYECPFPTHHLLPLQAVKNLAKSGRFFAYKETSCDIAKIGQVVDACQGTTMRVLQANIPFLLDALELGAAGSMNVVANWLPDLTSTVFHKAAKDPHVAAVLHQHLCVLELAQRSVHPRGVKYLLQKRGLAIKPYTRYKQKISAEEKKSIDIISNQWFAPNGMLLDMGILA